MLFNSIEYGLFLTIVLFSYYFLPHRYQNIFLLFASYIFYSFWDVRFLSLIIISTLVDFTCGLCIERAREVEDLRTMKLFIVLSLSANLGILCIFKYFNFFIENAQLLLTSIGLHYSKNVFKIILPVGISFYTFQTLSYTIDIYRGKIKPIRNIVDFALFVAFFPQLVAGPIERASNLIPQIQNNRQVTQAHWEKGLYLILLGLVMKIVIADSAGVLVDVYFKNPQKFTSLQLTIGLFLYSFQIYGDFSGYSKIARGSAMLLGFEIMRNFHHPYFASNFTDFWRRWHISLSTWLRDYLYIPLGGNRKGLRRTYFNLFATMLLGGLWHGASWNFIIWGGLHGLYLSIHRFFRERVSLVQYNKRFLEKNMSSKQKYNFLSFFSNKQIYLALYFTRKIIIITAIFMLVSLTWVFFRAIDLSSVLIYLEGLLKFTIDGESDLIPLFLIMFMTLIVDLPQALTNDEYCFLRLQPVALGLLAGIAIVLICLSGNVQEPFIYFQF